jgi:hypothetical protein
MASMIEYAGEEPEEFLKKWREKQHKVEEKSWSDLMIAGE